mmetsp:Transcript_12885/g.26397  ORF Transcript_12885/g.26397 Transcript_12885/m.26397 type:complete len:365 (+) Transcript_12885:2123-3217(+)
MWLRFASSVALYLCKISVKNPKRGCIVTLSPILHGAGHQGNGTHPRIVKIRERRILLVHEFVGIVLELFDVLFGETHGGEAHFVEQKVHVRFEQFVRGGQFHGQIDEVETEMDDAVGAESPRRSEVQGLADGSQELGGHVLGEVLCEFLDFVFGVVGNAVAGEEAGNDLGGPLFDLPPGPGVAFFFGGGLIPGLEALGRFREGFDERGSEDVEPGLHGLRVGERRGGGDVGGAVGVVGPAGKVELSGGPKDFEDLLEHQGPFQGVLFGAAEALGQGQEEGEGLDDDFVEGAALLAGFVLVAFTDFAEGQEGVVDAEGLRRVGVLGDGMEEQREQVRPGGGEVVNGDAVNRLGHQVADGFVGLGQ